MNSRTRALLLLMTCLSLAGRPLCAQTPQPSLSAALEVPSTNVFQNEEFPLTFVVVLRGVRAEKDIGVSSLPDANVLSIGPLGELPTRQFDDSGQACEVRRSFLVARARGAGPLEIAPTLRVHVRTGRTHIFTGAEEIVAYDVTVKPLALTVRPLPDSGKPASFSGAVGQFSFDVDVAPVQVAAGALVHVTPRIYGTGYLEAVTAPRLSPSPHFKIYDAKSISAPAGERAFDQVLIPQDTNAAAVPAVFFSFFEPRAGVYRTITRGPFPLTFVNPPAASPVPEPYRPPVQNAGVSTNPPVPSPVPARASLRFPGAHGWLVVAAGIAAGLVLLFLVGITALRRHRAVLLISLLLWLTVLIAFSSMASRRGWLVEPESLMMRHETARFAPSLSAMVSFELTEGTSVHVAEVRGEWAKISFGSQRGWVRTEALRRP